MNNNKKYLMLCRSVHNLKIPKIKFKELKDHYKTILNKEYEIDQEDINKVSFIILALVFITSFSLSILFSDFILIIIFSYSTALSLILAYFFNIKLYRIIYKDEVKINALLYLIRMYYSILRNTLPKDSDFVIIFIKLIKNYNLPFSRKFEQMLKHIQEGCTPEKELIDFISPSEDFNNYIKELIEVNFYNEFEFKKNVINSLEKRFKIYLKQIETRLSIIFFLGLFFPLSIGFLVLFNRINLYFLFLIVPIFYISQKLCYKKFIKSDIFLLGLLNNYNKKEKRKFTYFISFLKQFAIKLEKNLSPEKAFIDAFLFYKNKLFEINEIFQIPVTHLINFRYSFNEIIEFMQSRLKSFRYWIILDSLKKILRENAYESSRKIINILKLISKHKSLEKKLEIILKGEKLKVLLFLYLLPIIMGVIGGMFPLFMVIIESFPLYNSEFNPYFSLIFSYEFLTILLCLLICIVISSYYFLKIINHERKSFLIMSSGILFIIIFFISFLNIITLI